MRRIVSGIVLMVGLLGSIPGWAEDEWGDQGWKSVGYHFGWMATGRAVNFHQSEVYATYGLPWSLRSEDGWGAAMLINGAVGQLRAVDESGLIVALGPGVIFDKGGRGAAIELGGDLNGLSRDHFGNQYTSVDLNGHMLFDGHIGIMYRFDFGPGFGYRFQHMSNGGLNGKRNTGVDFHMIVVNWNFH